MKCSSPMRRLKWRFHWLPSAYRGVHHTLLHRWCDLAPSFCLLCIGVIVTLLGNESLPQREHKNFLPVCIDMSRKIDIPRTLTMLNYKLKRLLPSSFRHPVNSYEFQTSPTARTSFVRIQLYSVAFVSDAVDIILLGKGLFILTSHEFITQICRMGRPGHISRHFLRFSMSLIHYIYDIFVHHFLANISPCFRWNQPSKPICGKEQKWQPPPHGPRVSSLCVIVTVVAKSLFIRENTNEANRNIFSWRLSV